jgi:hypothetical protein
VRRVELAGEELHLGEHEPRRRPDPGERVEQRQRARGRALARERHGALERQLGHALLERRVRGEQRPRLGRVPGALERADEREQQVGTEAVGRHVAHGLGELRSPFALAPGRFHGLPRPPRRRHALLGPARGVGGEIQQHVERRRGVGGAAGAQRFVGEHHPQSGAAGALLGVGEHARRIGRPAAHGEEPRVAHGQVRAPRPRRRGRLHQRQRRARIGGGEAEHHARGPRPIDRVHGPRLDRHPDRVARLAQALVRGRQLLAEE